MASAVTTRSASAGLLLRPAARKAAAPPTLLSRATEERRLGSDRSCPVRLGGVRKVDWGGWARAAVVVWLLVAGSSMVIAESASAQARPRVLTAVTAVRVYLRALAVHDASGVCDTFSLQLKRFLRGWEPGRSCERRVATAHFSDASPGFSVNRIRIVAVGRMSEDAYGNLAVRLRLRYRYPCMFTGGLIPGCRPHVETRSDVLYLRMTGRRWLIVKPGEIYVETSSAAPPASFDPSTPPGDSATVNRHARLPSPTMLCPTGGVSAAARRRVLQPGNPGARPLPFSTAPWLGITSVRAVWVGRDQLCVTIALTGRPRSDTGYSIDIEQAHDGGGLSDSYGITINSVGRSHARLTDNRDSYSHQRAACPTDTGLSGNQLVLIVSPGDKAFDLKRPLFIDGSSTSLQPGEPLLAHPLNADDIVPALYGLKLPPPAGVSAARRCVTL